MILVMVFSSRCIQKGRSYSLYFFKFVSEVILGMLILWAGSSAFGTVFSIFASESDHDNVHTSLFVAHTVLNLLRFLYCNCKTSSDHFPQDSSSAHSGIGIERRELKVAFSNQSGTVRAKRKKKPRVV